MDGSATLTTVMSRTIISIPAQRTTRASQRDRSARRAGREHPVAGGAGRGGAASRASRPALSCTGVLPGSKLVGLIDQVRSWNSSLDIGGRIMTGLTLPGWAILG